MALAVLSSGLVAKLRLNHALAYYSLGWLLLSGRGSIAGPLLESDGVCVRLANLARIHRGRLAAGVLLTGFGPVRSAAVVLAVQDLLKNLRG